MAENGRLPIAESYRSLTRPPAVPGVEILRGGMPAGACAGGLYTSFTISAVDGAIQCHHRGSRHDLSGRYVVLVNQGEVLPTVAKGSNVVFEACCVRDDLLQRAADERGRVRTVRFSQLVSNDPAFYKMVKRVGAVLRRSVDALEQQEAITILIDRIFEDYAEGATTAGQITAPAAVRRMRTLIHDGFNQNLRLEVLASHARLNKFHALRVFKRETGLTPHEYQRRMRVGHAIHLLRKGRAIVEVAHAVGFCDQSHLTRAMRQVTFLTPGQYAVAGSRLAIDPDQSLRPAD
jgi:AraC-like DNA-binding protein